MSHTYTLKCGTTKVGCGATCTVDWVGEEKFGFKFQANPGFYRCPFGCSEYCDVHIAMADGRELKRRLRDVMPASFDLSCVTLSWTMRLEFVRQIHDKLVDRLVFRQQNWSPWPGPHKYVTQWYELVNGYAVGVNKNPRRGTTYPVWKMDRAAPKSAEPTAATTFEQFFRDVRMCFCTLCNHKPDYGHCYFCNCHNHQPERSRRDSDLVIAKLKDALAHSGELLKRIVAERGSNGTS